MRIITCLMLVLGIASPWAAHAAETPPPGGKPRDFQLVEPETIRLDNGLAATLVPFGDVPKTTVLVNVRTGNLNEGGRTWLADLTGELLTQGTASASGSEIAARAASMGGALTVSTGLEQTTLSIDVLEDHLALDLLVSADASGRPVCTGAVVLEHRVPEGIHLLLVRYVAAVQADPNPGVPVPRQDPGFLEGVHGQVAQTQMTARRC